MGPLRVPRGLVRTGRWIVICFCCWHMTAIAAMTIPAETQIAPAAWLRDTVRPVTDPYLNWTSQWQYWNLFAPNPTNWVTEHRIEALTGFEWETIEVISPQTLKFWRRADELKIEQRIEEEGQEAVRERYLQLACVRAGLPPDTLVRLILREQYLEREAAIPLPGPWQERETAITTCANRP